MPSKSYQGYFLTLEGGDGAGKSTLIRGLTAFLKEASIPVLTTAEPGGCDLGNAIRSLVLTQTGPLDVRAELALFLAARAQHVTEVIVPALQAGTFVICDRFHDSTIAYQGYGRQLGAERVAELSSFFAGHLEPDCTLYCDIAPQDALSRLKRTKDRLETESIEYHERVHQGFCALAEQHPERIHKLDAKQSPDKLLEQAKEVLKPCIARWTKWKASK